MIPDLRFIFGAVTATALLGITLFGLVIAVHLSHQGKVGPIEASRVLAFSPESGRRPAAPLDNPFAGLPVETSPQPAAPIPAAANAPEPAPSDADTVDERAVVDPPLSADGDEPVIETPTAAPTPANTPTVAPASAPAVAGDGPPPAVVLPPAAPVAASPVDTPLQQVPVQQVPVQQVPVQQVPVQQAPVQQAPVQQAPTATEATAPAAIAAPAAPAETAINLPDGVEARPEPGERPKGKIRKATAKKPVRRAATVPPGASTGYPISMAPTGGHAQNGSWRGD